MKTCLEVFWAKRSQNGLKLRFFKYCGKLTFEIFCIKLQKPISLKLILFEIVGINRPWNRAKIKFFRYYQKSVHRTFLIFCAWSSTKTKLNKMVFWENLYFEYLEPKGTENWPKMRFFKFWKKSFYETFLIFFAWSYSSIIA